VENFVVKSKIVSVCIDDFALKKRQRYGTVMVDIETRKIVDMIESRESADVSRWLTEYPNIRIVSRDGSMTYAEAITNAHPEALQISDRFHLVKGICNHATKIFQKLFQGRIAIPVTSQTQHRRMEMLIGTLAQKVTLVKQLRKEGRSKSDIRLLTGASERLINKYLDMKECDIPEEKLTLRGREHEEAIQKLLERAERVRALLDEGLSITAISQKTGFTAATVKRYLSTDFTPINAHYGKQREGKLEKYRDEALKLKAEGFTYKEIHNCIMAKGYAGTQDAIRGFVTKEQRIQRDLQKAIGDNSVEFIDKKWVISLLYKPAEKVKGLSKEQIERITEAYPIIQTIIDIVNEFKSLIKSKKPDLLDSWMIKVNALGLEELNSFVSGLKQDIMAVKNAIIYDFNNGLAEGTVNKIKVIKRVMYGKCKFRLLKCKCLLNEYVF
jgi:predicted transcriptional regulator